MNHRHVTASVNRLATLLEEVLFQSPVSFGSPLVDWPTVIGLLANFHLAASLPNCDWLELPYDPPAFTHDGRNHLLAKPLRVDPDGMVRIPDRPGLGIVLDEAYVAHLRAGGPAGLGRRHVVPSLVRA